MSSTPTPTPTPTPVCECNNHFTAPISIKGVDIVSSQTGAVTLQNFSAGSIVSCGNIDHPIGTVWLGWNGSSTGAFTYTLNFSSPIQSIKISLNGTGPVANETFTFTTNSGIPSILGENCSCYSSINGNTITSGGNENNIDAQFNTGGGYFLIIGNEAFTTLTISGPGGHNGSTVAICDINPTLQSTPVAPTPTPTETEAPTPTPQPTPAQSICSTKIRYYSLELVFKVFVDPNIPYGKIVDFKNRTKDAGFYIYNILNKKTKNQYSRETAGSYILFSPNGGVGIEPLIENEYNQIIITRDIDEKVKVYLNSKKQLEFNDYNKEAVIETENLIFFKDDEVSNDTENYKFLVSKIKLTPQAISELEAENSSLFHGNIVNCVPQDPGPTITPIPPVSPNYCAIHSEEEIPENIYVYKSTDSCTICCTSSSSTSPPVGPGGCDSFINLDYFVP